MATTSKKFDEAYASFVSECQEMVRKYYSEKFPTLSIPVLQSEEGTRYFRIVREQDNARSVFAFVDSLNGDILKPATWKAPAKHARGNIFDPNPLARVTHYGPMYMK